MNINKNKFIYFFYFVSGIGISFYFLWIRLLKERLPKEITFNWSLGAFILNLLLFTVFMYILKKKLYPQESKNKILLLLKEKMIVPLSNIIILWYKNSLQKVLELMLADMPLPHYQDKVQVLFMPFFYKLAEKLNLIDNKGKFMALILVVIYLPRVLVVSCFCYDIIIAHKFVLFYKMLWLLIIPLFWNIFYAIIKQMALQYIEIIKDAYTLVFSPIEVGDKSGFTVKMIRKKESCELPEEVEENIKNFYLKAWLPIKIHFIEIYDQQKIIEEYKSINVLTMCILGIYVLCFGYLTIRIGLTYFL